MRKQGMTISEAAHEWVGRFNAFPYGMIETLMRADPESWHELTKPSYGDRVYVLDLPRGSTHEGEVKKYLSRSDKYRIKLDDGTEISTTEDNLELNFDDILPMWGTLWQFDDICDTWWIENENGIRALSEAGFRVYEHDEWGYFFGIDGAGYDFYEAHWLPLYKARGLQWHDPKAS